MNYLHARCLRVLLLTLLPLAACSGDEYPPTIPAQITQQGLLELANSDTPSVFSHLKNNAAINGIRREVVTYRVDGLLQHALVLWPRGAMPGKGWPVLLFNHGFHPDPPQYGRVEDGHSDRPGDYYRGIPQAFAEAGYVVVTPDYRGHNDSQGIDFVGTLLAPWWYTRDVIGAYHSLPSLENVDTGRVYLLGHSMGGIIAQSALLALGPAIRAASIWSTSAPSGPGPVPAELDYRPHMSNLQVPLLIQHASGDQTTPVSNSLALANLLDSSRRVHELVLYDSDNHLFAAENFRRAIQRDLDWFARNP